MLKAIQLPMRERSEEELRSLINPAKVPRHLAIIMDGNRRWARERSLPHVLGHKAGVKSLKVVAECCIDVGIPILTVYAFSVENWRRSQREVEILLRLFEYYSRREREDLRRNGVHMRIIGLLDSLPERLRNEFQRTEVYTRGSDRLTLNLAVNYGGREEILHAVRSIAHDVRDGLLAPEAVDEALFSGRLYTHGLPDPDLLIRTSGEQRISNFLLWQLAYTEFYFTPRYWPDFDRKELLLALVDFQERERRFGGST
jgi:undecaprenyl diphosphate synthase